MPLKPAPVRLKPGGPSLHPAFTSAAAQVQGVSFRTPGFPIKTFVNDGCKKRPHLNSCLLFSLVLFVHFVAIFFSSKKLTQNSRCWSVKYFNGEQSFSYKLVWSCTRQQASRQRNRAHCAGALSIEKHLNVPSESRYCYFIFLAPTF